MNKVVLGDLSKYKGDDCLMFDGVDDYATITQTSETLHLEVTLGEIFPRWNVISQIGSFYTDYDGYILYRDSASRLAVNSNIDTSVTIGPIVNQGDTLEIDVVNTGTEVLIYMSDILVITHPKNQSGTFVGRDVKLMKRDNTDYSQGCINAIDDGNYSYINNGDFGDNVLTSTPTGSDGTITGAVWWKQGIDEQYDTAQLYKSAWAIPMAESQDVIYTDAEPYYPTNDVFWEPYNIDPVYSFNVSRQSVYSYILTRLLLQEMDDMKILRTIKGVDLGTGIEKLTPSAVAIKSTEAGLLRVKYVGDATFTDVEVLPDNIFYPCGNIREVDVPNSVVDITNVDFGFDTLLQTL